MATLQRNLVYFKEQFSAAVGKSSVVVKFVAAAVTLGYLLSFPSSIIPYITVTPGYVMPPNFWIWTYFTHCFIEFHIWEVLVDIAVVILFGKLLEPLWGAMDMLIFFGVVNIGVALSTSFLYIFIYFVTRNEDYLFDTHIHGLAGYIAGFSVAVKQVMPDHVLLTSPFGKLRNTHIPLLLVCITIVLRLVRALDGPYPFMFGLGMIVSWTYLRFYQKHTNGNRGDMAENFSFASFFPSRVQPFVAVIANTIFSGMVKIKVCKKPQRKYDVSSPSTITISLPGTDPLDAERRRQVAIKALNERLNKSMDSPAKWPSMEDADVECGKQPPTTTTTITLPTKIETPSGVEKRAPSPKLPIIEFKESSNDADGSSAGDS